MVPASSSAAPARPGASATKTEPRKEEDAKPIFSSDDFVPLGAATSKGKKTQAKTEVRPSEDEKRKEKEEERKLAGTAWGKSGEEVRKAQAAKRDLLLKQQREAEERSAQVAAEADEVGKENKVDTDA